MKWGWDLKLKKREICRIVELTTDISSIGNSNFDKVADFFITFKSTNKPIISENAELKETLRDKTEEIIYGNRKTNHLSTHESLERGEDYS